jgi:hypothetical protein
MSTLAILPPSSLVQPLGSSWFGSASSSKAQTPSKSFSFGDKAFSARSGAAMLQECDRLKTSQLPLLREHAEACRTLHMIDQSDLHDPHVSINAVPSPCRDFLVSLPHSATESFAQFDLQGENDLKGYKFLLKLIAAMTGEGLPPPGRNKPGYFSPVVADSQHQSTTRELRDRREMLSTGARVHLENDYRNDVIKPESAAYMRNVSGTEKTYDLIGGLEAAPDFGQDDQTLLEEVQRYVSAILPPAPHQTHGYSIECDDSGVLFWPQVRTVLCAVLCSTLFIIAYVSSHVLAAE